MQCLLMPMLLRTEERGCKEKESNKASDIRRQIDNHIFFQLRHHVPPNIKCG